MTIICNFLCRFQIYRCFFSIISSLGDNYGIFGYFELCSFSTKSQGHLKSLTSDILVITGNFLINLIYLYSL